MGGLTVEISATLDDRVDVRLEGMMMSGDGSDYTETLHAYK